MLDITVSAACDAAIAPVGAPTLSEDEIQALIADAAPKLVPAGYADRVVSVVGRHPTSGRVVNYRKEYRLKPGTDGGRADDWADDTDLRASAHSVREAYLDNLDDVRDLLTILARSPQASAVLGRLRAEKRLISDADAWLVGSRSQEFYEDRPTRLLPVDVDHLDCDPLDAGDALNDYITEHMPELEGCGYVWTHTGSSGVKKGARVRLWFLLAEPRHLAGCAAWARSVNERAGFAVIDATIYGPGHLVLTAGPELLDANGDKYPRPAPAGVWHARGDLVPADAFPDVLPGEPTAVGSTSVRAPREKLTAVAAAALLEGIGPGNYNGVIHRWLCHVAWSTPERSANAAFESAVATIVERIQETSEAEHLDQRLRIHANQRALRRTWDAARERLRQRLAADAVQLASAAVAGTLLPSIGTIKIDTTGAGDLSDYAASDLDDFFLDDVAASAAPMPIDQVRAQLAADFDRVADSVSLKGAKGHWLFRHPPGAGKSARLASLATPGSLSSNLVRIRVPDHRLAEQTVANLQAVARSHNADPALYGDLADRIRHHKGRSQEGMCVDPVSRPKADRAEALGVSPKKVVCANCASAATCRWLAQDQDDESGIIVEVHASAVAIKRQRRADLTIVDENIVGSIIEAGAESVDLASLAVTGTMLGAPNELGSLGPIWVQPTMALKGYRADLVAALRIAMPQEGGPGKLLISTLGSFSSPATFRARDGFRTVDRVGTALDEAIELEAWLQTSLVQQIVRAEDVGKDARPLRAHLTASRQAASLYEAIAASMKCERECVFGIATYREQSAGKRRELVKLATRATDVANVFGDASITMDGTADEAVWRAIVSPTGTDVDTEVVTANVAIDGAFVRCTQYADKAGSASSLMARGGLDEGEHQRISRLQAVTGSGRWARSALGAAHYDQELAVATTAVAIDTINREERKRRADSNLSLVHRLALFKAAEAAPKAVDINGRRVAVLLVAQKAVGEQIVALGLPNGVAVEHFGKLRGINAYERVPVAIVVGRSRPANIDLELLTEALRSHNPAIKTVGRYDVNPKEGRHWLERHPDELVAALQAQITAAGVKQAVARIRAYDRTAASPVEVHVFGTYDPGLPADVVQRRAWVDADRSPVEIAAARGCVFDDARLNALAHPGVFPRGAKNGRGRVDREGKAKFAELLGNLARPMLERSLHVEHEFGLKPYREVGEPDSRSLLQLETEFGLQPQLCAEDALDFTADGADQVRGRRHRLVKLRVPGIGYASYAIVDVTWSEADVACLLGARIEAWGEQSADDLRRHLAGQSVRRPDTR